MPCHSQLAGNTLGEKLPTTTPLTRNCPETTGDWYQNVQGRTRTSRVRVTSWPGAGLRKSKVPVKVGIVASSDVSCLVIRPCRRSAGQGSSLHDDPQGLLKCRDRSERVRRLRRDEVVARRQRERHAPFPLDDRRTGERAVADPVL